MPARKMVAEPHDAHDQHDERSEDPVKGNRPIVVNLTEIHLTIGLPLIVGGHVLEASSPARLLRSLLRRDERPAEAEAPEVAEADAAAEAA